MQDINKIINTLADAGIHAYLENGKLKTKSLKGALTPELINLIKNNKDQIIKKINTDSLTDEVEIIEHTPIIAIAREDHQAKTSYAQQRLWFIDKMDGGSAHYNMPFVLDVQGDFRVESAQKAFKQIIKRHEPLRTVFINTDKGPIQDIRENFEFTITLSDLSKFENKLQKQAVDSAIKADAELSFDLSKDLMLRVSYLQLDDNRGVMLLNIHHIASDGWSTSVLIKEFNHLYNCYLEGREEQLPSLKINYADFADWQHKWLQGDVLERQLNYWDKQLSELPQLHSLPLDFKRPQLQTYHGALHHFALNEFCLKRLQTIALGNKSTLFMLIHAAFSIVLCRYSNNIDIVIGTPVANRLDKVLEPLIGFFANTLVLRADCSNNPIFEDFLTQIREVNLDAQANQDVPFEHLVDSLNPTRSTSHNALFQILLLMDGDKIPAIDINAAEIIKRDSDQVPIKFELTLNMSIDEDGKLDFIFQYNTDLFELKTIQRLASSLQLLLKGIAEDSTQRIFELPLLSADETNHLIHTVNETNASYSTDLCIHQLFEKQVHKCPNDIAVRFDQHSLSYSELNQHANQLAHYLLEQGVDTDSMIGLCIERSLEMIIGLLAILKSGAAYLPLDSLYPKGRLSHMIRDSGLSLILTDQKSVSVIKQIIKTNDTQTIKHINLDDKLLNSLSDYPLENPVIQGLTSEHLAYVIYTSGSTGQPKGVLQKHATITNLLQAQVQGSGLKNRLITLQFAPISFDVSIQEIATCWYTASPLIIISEQAKQELNRLPKLLQKHAVQRVFLPPAVLNWLTEEMAKTTLQLPELREIIVAGEALVISKYLKSYLTANSNCRLWNHYGPTETHVASIALIDVNQQCLSQPIGKVLTNLTGYILDKHQELVPYGAIGELYIGGRGLAKAYLNQPELTKQKFIANPLKGKDEILYSTGDLVRYLSDGQLAFIGRADEQVQIRGFRIELGEIEQQLNRLDIVQSAVVVVHIDDNNEKQLLAYVNPDRQYINEADDLIIRLRSELQMTLPDYMLPSMFVILDKMPLTINGKIDKKALPKPDLTQSSRNYVAPKNKIEVSLEKIWSKLLKTPSDQIGSYAHFFEIGGHSLLSVRLISEIRERFNAELSIREIFEYPQLFEQALIIASAKQSRLPIITPVATNMKKLALSFAQQRLWFIDQMEGNSRQYNMAGSLKIEGDFNIDAAEIAFTKVIQRHQPLRTVIIKHNNELFQQIKENFDFSIICTDLSSLPENEKAKELQHTLNKHSNINFDLSQDLMLSVQHIKLTKQQSVLAINVHHIAIDGWSLSILMNEFSQYYQAFIDGDECELPHLVINYVDYACWQRKWIQGDILEQQLSYWQQQLAEIPQVHNLPLDFERPAYQTFNGELHSFSVTKTTLLSLKSLALKNNASLFMVIHAVFSILLARYSNNSNIVIGTPVANRLQKELQNLIGYFVNTLILRADCSNNPSFIEFLAQIKNTNLDAQENQDVPFEHLVDRLNPPRSTSHNAIFQIMLSMDTNESYTLSLPDVEISDIENNQTTAKFDLSLYITENEDLNLVFEYNRDLFKAATIAQFAQSLQILLEAIAVDPQQRIAELPLLDDKQKHHLLHELNNTNRKFPKEICIHQLFEQQVIKTPDNIALIFEQQTLSYSELNRQANQLAHYLIKQGIKPDDIVGLCMHRSIEMMVAMLGILKAGAAYLPLDPSYPQGRLDHMLNDSNLTVVISQQKLFNLIQGKAYKKLILDNKTFQNTLDNYANNNPVIPKLNSRHLAYVIYTSGSTGLPKGVMVEHQALINRIDWMQNEYQLTANDVVLQKTPYSFDVSVWELNWFYTVGATLVIAVADGHKDPVYLIETIQKNQITTLHFVPSMLRSMLAHKAWGDCHSLAQVFCSGEALAIDLPELHYQLNNAQLHNLYGPTEAAIDVSYWPVPKASLKEVPIGKPIQNIQLLVLNDAYQLQPKGAAGELFIAGIGLARGYLNQPQLTSEKFVENNYSAISSQRLYRTGDLVRYLDDGNLAFLGRVDHQVKLRGFRIELGEIEYQLSSHPDIEASVVLVREDKPGQKLLVAYFTSDSIKDDADLIEDIRQLLQAQLPDYMVPSRLIRLQTMPLSANGKIDRKLLPQVEYIQTTDDIVKPINDVERILLEIWSGLLKIPKESISTKANFFELGGDSILSIQVVSRAQEAQLIITVKQIFEYQCIHDVAPYVSKSKGLTIEQHSITGQQLLLPIVKEFFNNEIALNHYNQAVLYKTPKDFDSTLFTNLIEQLYKRHDVLRLRFHQGDKSWQAEYSGYSKQMLESSLVYFNIDENDFDQLSKYGAELQKSLDIENGPIFRAVYCQNKKQQGRLLFIFHHLLIDGVSWRIIQNDIEKMYSQYQQNKKLSLADKTSSYQDWSQYLYRISQDEKMISEQGYWQQILDKPIPTLTQNSTQLNAGFSQQDIIFNEKLTKKLLTNAASAYNTQVNELLLAGLLLGTYKWCGNKSIKIDLEGHGREALTDRVDLSQTLGWFTSIYPVVLHSETMQLDQLICAIKENYRNIPNQGIGFGLLKYINPILQNSDIPAPILFNYHGKTSDESDSSLHFPVATEYCGETISDKRKQSHDILFNGAVINDKLSFRVDFNQALYSDNDIQNFLTYFEQALSEIVEHCIDPTHGYFTPSDFPLTDVVQKQLDQWQDEYVIQNIYPATAMQQGLLYHSSLNKGAYVSQMIFDLGVQTNIKALHNAWQKVVNRHDVLRTVFVSTDEGETQQIVVENVELPWTRQCIEEMNVTEQNQLIEKARLKIKSRGFNTEQAPLIAIELWHLGENKHRILISNHHTLLDGWSYSLLFNEVVQCYQAYVNQQQPQLESAIAYHHYIKWLMAQDNTKARDFWRTELATVESSCSLSKQYNPELSAGEVIERLTFNLDQTQALEKMAQSCHVTLNTLLQAAWAYLLARYCNERTVVFATTVSGRPANLAKVEHMIGLFINTIPVKVEIDINTPLSEWFNQLHQAQINRDEYSYLPLVEILSLTDYTNDNPMLESLFVFENYPVEESSFSSKGNDQLDVSELQVFEESNYNLSVMAVIVEEQLNIKFSAKKNYFDSERLSQISQHFKQIIKGLVASANKLDNTLRDIPLLTKKERGYLLNTLNDTATDYPAQLCMQQLFQQQVESYPDNIALVYQQKSLTYSELNSKANQLAHHLITQGISPDDLIGLCVERSLEMMIGLLAILKAGAAYLPLDPSYPRARLNYIINDSQINLVISQKSLLNITNNIDNKNQCLQIVLDDSELMQKLNDYPSDNPVLDNLSSRHLSYVIYTSGSTGQPKGVMLEHQGAVNLALAQISHLSVTAESRVLQFASINFDAATSEWMMALMSGASLYICQESSRYNPKQLTNYLQSNKVSHATLPPAVLQHMVLDNCYAFKALVVAGEAFDETLSQQWGEHYSFYNAYGPTEATVCATISAPITAQLNIGKAIANTQLYVLDINLQVLPAGSIGELYIGGVGLARGYLNKQDLTTECFIEHSFDGITSQRIYKTGDLVRLQKDGSLVFIGRSDHQVKIRGFRVELEEIEQKIMLQNDVQSVLAMVNQEQGEKKLIAYLTTSCSIDNSRFKKQLRKDLHDLLPDYMVPSVFILLDKFPLTVNGKIDRKALPAPEMIEQENDYQAPVGVIEQGLVKIWSKLLKIPEQNISREANFFDLGGHSLLAVKLLTNIRTQFEIKLIIQDLFDSKTLAVLAVHLAMLSNHNNITDDEQTQEMEHFEI